MEVTFEVDGNVLSVSTGSLENAVRLGKHPGSPENSPFKG